MLAARTRPRKCFPSVCVSKDKHVTSDHKMWISCSSLGSSFFSHGCVSEGEQVCVSFLYVYGRSKLWYRVLAELPTATAEPPVPACGKWCNPIYLRFSGSPLGFREQTGLRKQTELQNKVSTLLFSSLVPKQKAEEMRHTEQEGTVQTCPHRGVVAEESRR